MDGYTQLEIVGNYGIWKDRPKRGKYVVAKAKEVIRGGNVLGYRVGKVVGTFSTFKEAKEKLEEVVKSDKD